MRLRFIFLSVLIIAIGGFFLFHYVPSVREGIILATTMKPETLTELYFENHRYLPDKVDLFERNSFQFTIHNLENKDMEYTYEVYMEINGETKTINQNSVLVKKDEYMTNTEECSLSIPTQSAKVVVRLINKNQQIHFWIREEMQRSANIF